LAVSNVKVMIMRAVLIMIAE